MSTCPVELSQKLMRHASISGVKDPGALDDLQEELEGLGFKCTRMPFSEEGNYDVDNLYARLGDSGRNLCFAGHTDVVPIGDEKDWSVDPFEAVIKDDMLIGRGAVDMKPAIAAWAAAVSETGKPENGSISLLITGDEEAVSINGTVKMLKQLDEMGEKLDACIVGEPTNPEKLGEMAKIGRRGSFSGNIIVHGTQGHSAYPHLADNPVTRLMNIITELKKHTLDEGTDFFQPSNLEITGLDAFNKAANIIPAKAEAIFSIRFNDQHTGESLTKWINSICEKHCDNYELANISSYEAFITEPGELSQIVVKATKNTTGLEPELSTTGGTSDARFIKDYCTVVEFGLINQTAHKVDEQVKTQDIVLLKDIYKAIIEGYFAE